MRLGFYAYRICTRKYAWSSTTIINGRAFGTCLELRSAIHDQQPPQYTKNLSLDDQLFSLEQEKSESSTSTTESSLFDDIEAYRPKCEKLYSEAEYNTFSKRISKAFLRQQLLDYCVSRGIQVSKSATKAYIIKRISQNFHIRTYEHFNSPFVEERTFKLMPYELALMGKWKRYFDMSYDGAFKTELKLDKRTSMLHIKGTRQDIEEIMKAFEEFRVSIRKTVIPVTSHATLEDFEFLSPLARLYSSHIYYSKESGGLVFSTQESRVREAILLRLIYCACLNKLKSKAKVEYLSSPLNKIPVIIPRSLGAEHDVFAAWERYSEPRNENWKPSEQEMSNLKKQIDGMVTENTELHIGFLIFRDGDKSNAQFINRSSQVNKVAQLMSTSEPILRDEFVRFTLIRDPINQPNDELVEIDTYADLSYQSRSVMSESTFISCPRLLTDVHIKQNRYGETADVGSDALDLLFNRFEMFHIHKTIESSFSGIKLEENEDYKLLYMQWHNRVVYNWHGFRLAHTILRSDKIGANRFELTLLPNTVDGAAFDLEKYREAVHRFLEEVNKEREKEPKYTEVKLLTEDETVSKLYDAAASPSKQLHRTMENAFFGNKQI